jgi:hypothetical protein
VAVGVRPGDFTDAGGLLLVVDVGDPWWKLSTWSIVLMSSLDVSWTVVMRTVCWR